jgi:chemotaxis signal transduction protein
LRRSAVGARRRRRVRSLPHGGNGDQAAARAAHCLGLVDWRGRLVPLFDLGARRGITPPRSERQLVDRFLVLVEQLGGPVCCAVDELHELVESTPVALSTGDRAAPGRLVTGAMHCGDGRLAPLIERSALLGVRARQQVAAALELLRANEASRP